MPANTTDADAITAARCPLNHSGPHIYDVIPGGWGKRLAGQCRGCGGMISADEAQAQPREEREREEAIAQADREQRERAMGLR